MGSQRLIHPRTKSDIVNPKSLNRSKFRASTHVANHIAQ